MDLVRGRPPLPFFYIRWEEGCRLAGRYVNLVNRERLTTLQEMELEISMATDCGFSKGALGEPPLPLAPWRIEAQGLWGYQSAYLNYRSVITPAVKWSGGA